MVIDYFNALGSAVEVVSGPDRMSGGASRETWAVDVRFDGDRVVPLVFRGQFGEQELAASLGEEHAAMTALHRSGQPIPKPYPLIDSDEDPSFIIMQRVAGSDLRKTMPTIPDVDKTQLGAQLISIIFGIHRIDPQTVGTANRSYHSALQDQLDQWILPVLDDDAGGEIPLLRAAARHLDLFRPDDGPVVLLHGDFKANNILVSQNRVTAILDWELCHSGDPLADLAWTLLWTTRWDIIGGLFDRQQFLDCYAATSGLHIDPDRLAYWELFSATKLAAILRRQGQEAHTGHPSPMLAQLGRAVAHCESTIATLLIAMEQRS